MMGIALTTDGDWDIQEGQAPVLYEADAFLQSLLVFLKTQPGDLGDDPLFGFDRHKYVGMPNNTSTATALKTELYDGIMALADSALYEIIVDVYPIDRASIRVQIDITSSEGSQRTIEEDITLGSSSADSYGYSINDHTSYDETTSRPIIEKITLTEAANGFYLAHLPINLNIHIYPDSSTLSVTDGVVNLSESAITHTTWTVTTPSGYTFNDVSGNIINGNLLATQFMLDRSLVNDVIVYAISNDEYIDCTINAPSGAELTSLYNTMSVVSPESASGIGYTYNGDVTFDTSSITFDRNIMTIDQSVSGFSFDIATTDAVATGVNIEEEQVTLDKYSIGYFSRSDKQWYLTLSTTLQPGSYIVEYTTFDYA